MLLKKNLGTIWIYNDSMKDDKQNRQTHTVQFVSVKQTKKFRFRDLRFALTLICGFDDSVLSKL